MPPCIISISDIWDDGRSEFLTLSCTVAHQKSQFWSFCSEFVVVVVMFQREEKKITQPLYICASFALQACISQLTFSPETSADLAKRGKVSVEWECKLDVCKRLPKQQIVATIDLLDTTHFSFCHTLATSANWCAWTGWQMHFLIDPIRSPGLCSVDYIGWRDWQLFFSELYPLHFPAE